jgi:hypothetical protein
MNAEPDLGPTTDGRCCGALSPSRKFGCTRALRHDGDHIAHAGRSLREFYVCERWTACAATRGEWACDRPAGHRGVHHDGGDDGEHEHDARGRCPCGRVWTADT